MMCHFGQIMQRMKGHTMRDYDTLTCDWLCCRDAVRPYVTRFQVNWWAKWGAL